MGAMASAAWLRERGLDPADSPHWYVEITLVAGDPPLAHVDLNIYPEEWGYVLRVANRVSSIRITDEPFVHGSDDHRMLATTPALANFGELIRDIESHRGLAFSRSGASIRTNLTRGTPIVRAWLNTL